MADRYCVVDRATGEIIDAIMLDGPEAETEDHRYVICDGTAGIGWRLTEDGPVPPAEPEMPEPTPATIANEIAALQAKLDAIREASV